MRHALIGLVALLWTTAAWGQGPIPDDRYIVTQDVDYLGADRTALFDTTFYACVRACSADDACIGFTFNDRSNACFPKAQINEEQPYIGARSARRFAATEDLKSAAVRRAAALDLPQADFDESRGLATDLGLRFAQSGQTVGRFIGGVARRVGSWGQGGRLALDRNGCRTD